MNKAQLIEIIAENNGFYKKDCEDLVNEIFAVMADKIVEDGKVSIPGFGSFVLEKRGERAGFNPRTREDHDRPAHGPEVLADERLEREDQRDRRRVATN